jgi:hypothetical protein
LGYKFLPVYFGSGLSAADPNLLEVDKQKCRLALKANSHLLNLLHDPYPTRFFKERHRGFSEWMNKYSNHPYKKPPADPDSREAFPDRLYLT